MRDATRVGDLGVAAVVTQPDRCAHSVQWTGCRHGGLLHFDFGIRCLTETPVRISFIEGTKSDCLKSRRKVLHLLRR